MMLSQSGGLGAISVNEICATEIGATTVKGYHRECFDVIKMEGSRGYHRRKISERMSQHYWSNEDEVSVQAKEISVS